MVSVVIIDDEPEIREQFAADIDSATNLRCAAAYPDCESALIRIEQDLPDVILLDINMPGRMSGIHGVRRIKAVLPEVQIIMITIQQDQASVFDSLAAGACGYLVKEVARPELIRAIEEVQRGGAPMTMSIARMVVQHFQNKSLPSPLSARQQEVLNKLCEGKSYKAIADELYVSVATVKFHIGRIYEALHVCNRMEAMIKVRQQNC